MADVIDEIKTYLGTIGAIQAFIGVPPDARIYHNRARQSRKLPNLVLEENAGEVVDVLVSDSGLVSTVVNFWSYGVTRTECNGLSDACRKNFHTFQGLMGEVHINEVYMPQYRSTRVIPPKDSGQGYLFETLQQYTVWHQIDSVALTT